MIKKLPRATEEHPEPRDEYVDGPFQVATWGEPFTVIPESREPVPAGAPAWWHGEEEASSSFFKAMGLKLGPDGEVTQR